MSEIPHSSMSNRLPRLALWLPAGVLLGFWSVLIWRLGGLWSTSPEYSYGWAVPLLCLMMFYDRWRTRPNLERGSSLSVPGRGIEGEVSPLSPGGASGPASRRAVPGGSAVHRPQSRGPVVFVVFCLIAFILARLALEVFPNWRFAAWPLALATIILTLLLLRMMLESSRGQQSAASGQGAAPAGSSASPRNRKSGIVNRKSGAGVSHFAFPICFFLLAVPWPERFETPFIQTLTQMNATVTVELLSFLKVVAVRMGNIILIEPGMVGVQEACSGIRSFQSTLMVALFLGELFRFSFWRRCVFVVLGACLSFAFNIVRTSTLVWFCNRDGLGAVDKFHDPAGWSILAASVAGLALIGWWLNRQQTKAQSARHNERGAGSRKSRSAAVQPALECGSSLSALGRGIEGEVSPPSPGATRRADPFPNPKSSGPSPFNPQLASLGLFLLVALVVTELGINAWFRMHENPRQRLAEWNAQFDTVGGDIKLLQSNRELQALLNFDRGDGWEWQGGGAERWQAFYFIWDPPKTLARQVAIASASLQHQPEDCFRLAGMQMRQFFGERRFVANGVPLGFKVYEFTDRNIPIFVFSCIWKSGSESATGGEPRTGQITLGNERLRNLVSRIRRGDRISSEMRVLKFGVWGPRTIDEAEAAFQLQLNRLIRLSPHPHSLSPSEEERAG